MRPSAQDQFYPEMLLLEASRGPINWLYFDTHKDDDGKPDPLATFGLGTMEDAGGKLTGYALALPWRRRDGSWDVPETEVAAEYTRLKKLGIQSQGGYAYEKHASLFLDQAVVQWDFERNAAGKEAAVRKLIPNWADLRADAELAAMSMVWNVGPRMFDPSFRKFWPNLTAALKTENYVRAADNCLINGTTSERNRRNRKMFLQAARAKVMKSSPDTLFGATVKVSASHIVNGTPTTPGSHAFWAQALLRDAGAYTSVLDGLFGPVSLAAWTKAIGEGKPTLAGLSKLCQDSKWTLGFEAGA